MDAILLKNTRSRCIRMTEEATSRTGPGDGSRQRAPSKGTVFAIAVCTPAAYSVLFIFREDTVTSVPGTVRVSFDSETNVDVAARGLLSEKEFQAHFGST